jgi:hypothetical protein
MRLVRMAACAAIVAGSALASLPASAQPREAFWQPLGCREVGFNADRDVIPVGNNAGRFSAIRLSARGNAVEMLDLRVYYLSGQPDDIPVRAVIRPGAYSGNLPLEGARERGLARIEMVYRAVPNQRGRATVCADGLRVVQAGPGPGPAPRDFEELGCQDVGFGVDRDAIRVGRQEGTFSAVRVRTHNNAIELFDLIVTYGNGRSDNIRVRTNIVPGRPTGWLDLQGGNRGINRIDMVYRARPGFGGRARVCVDGRF